MADDEMCYTYMKAQQTAIEAQMDAYILARDELSAAQACDNWLCAKKRASVILRRTLELQELEAEQAAGLNRTDLINMTKNVIVTLKEAC
jgi:hypothetical protein